MNIRTDAARRYWVVAVGPERSERANRHLAYLLAFVAGFLNSVGFVAVAQYTSHMTGVVAHIADDLALHGLRVIGVGVLALVSFVVGAATCALVFNWARRREMNGRFAIVVALQAVLMLGFGALAQNLQGQTRVGVCVAVLCFTMGLQNAIITKISGARIRTTHVTGMVTDIGIELGKALYPNRRTDIPRVRADLAKLRMHLGVVGTFAGGGVLGALGYQAVGFPVLVPCALVLLALSLPPIVADVVRH